MIEVFKTNIEKAEEAQELVALLREHFPASRINVDLHDCDKILRVEGSDFVTNNVMDIVTANGYHCAILD